MGKIPGLTQEKNGMRAQTLRLGPVTTLPEAVVVSEATRGLRGRQAGKKSRAIRLPLASEENGGPRGGARTQPGKVVLRNPSVLGSGHKV